MLCACELLIVLMFSIWCVCELILVHCIIGVSWSESCTKSFIYIYVCVKSC